jgi:2-oxoglutarate ferredoxin oxidoreductase subunit gamma
MQLTEIRIAGFGGQGVILSAVVLGKAASIFQGAFATMTQNFGPEARGGACSAQLVLSDSPILYPYVTQPDILVVTSQEAYARFAPELKDGGILIVEEDLVRVDPSVSGNKEIQVYSIPATRIAEVLGKRMVQNSVMVGFFAAVTQLLDPEAVGKAVADSVPAGFRELNLKAFEKGLEYGITALTAAANPADAELQEQYSPE